MIQFMSEWFGLKYNLKLIIYSNVNHLLTSCRNQLRGACLKKIS